MKTIEELCKTMEREMSVEHTYESICNTMVTLLLETFDTLNDQPQGGVTATQAQFIFGTLYARALHPHTKVGVCIRDMDCILEPDGVQRLCTISQETWADIRAQAARNLRLEAGTSPRSRAYWTSLVEGRLPPGLKVE